MYSLPLPLYGKPITKLHSENVIFMRHWQTCPTLTPARKATYSIYSPRRDERLMWPWCWLYIRLPSWFTCPQIVSHPSSNLHLRANRHDASPCCRLYGRYYRYYR